jgi:glycosyltransferase involved in cell wall biosynthesis
MIILAYVILFFAGIQLLVAVSNLFWGRFEYHTHNTQSAIISILIPARNEEHNISNLLNDLTQLPYNIIEIIVFDDQSTDATFAVVKNKAQKDERIRVIQSTGLPDGWLGKNYACHCLAEQATGEYLLFLDADVRIAGNFINNMVGFAQQRQLALLSIFPKQIMHTPGEWASVPLMNYILLSLLPLPLVMRSGFTSLSAANGQCMLFDADIYRKIWSHRQFKHSRVEDIEIARFYKHNKLKIACLAARHNITCRMYTGFREAVNGFSKNVTHFFGGSQTISFFFWLLTTLGVVPVIWALTGFYVYLYLAVVLATRIVIAVTSGQSVSKNLLFLIPQQFALILFIYKFFINKQKHETLWKGRNISVCL